MNSSKIIKKLWVFQSKDVENYYSLFQGVQTPENVGWVGWERNDRGNFGPKLANMSASMDPVKLVQP